MTDTATSPGAIRVLPTPDRSGVPILEPDLIFDAELVDDAADSETEESGRRSNAGRKSVEERAARRAEAERRRIEAEEAAENARRRLEVESKRAIRIQPDTKGVLNTSFIMSAVVLGTSFLISYFTLAAAAEWMRLPSELPWLRFAVPGFIELAIILSSVFYAIERSRGGKGRQFMAVQWTLTLVAAFANAAHTIREWGADWGLENWESLVGTALAAAAPLVVVWVSKSLSRIVFAEPEK